MENVLSLLHRWCGPLIFAIGVSCAFLMQDVLSTEISTMKDKILSNEVYDYGIGDEELVDFKVLKGTEIKSLIGNGGRIGTEYKIREPGVGDTVITYSNTDFSVQGVYTNLEDLFSSINDNFKYKVVYTGSPSYGYTKATFTHVK